MKQIYEVTLTYVALVLADDSDEAEEIARDERDEITSDDTRPKIESGVSIRSRKELQDHAGWNDLQWDECCLPYGLEGDDADKTLGQILERIEVADQAESEALSGRCPNTVDMFEEPKPIKAPEPARPPDFRLLVARKFANQGDDWNWCRMEYIGEGEGAGALIEGGLPNIDCRGEQRWTGVRLDKLFVSEAQVASASLAWEQENGKCHKCAGSGQMNTGWSSTEGNRYAECNRCGGDGKAQAVTS